MFLIYLVRPYFSFYLFSQKFNAFQECIVNLSPIIYVVRQLRSLRAQSALFGDELQRKSKFTIVFSQLGELSNSPNRLSLDFLSYVDYRIPYKIMNWCACPISIYFSSFIVADYRIIGIEIYCLYELCQNKKFFIPMIHVKCFSISMEGWFLLCMQEESTRVC